MSLKIRGLNWFIDDRVILVSTTRIKGDDLREIIQTFKLKLIETDHSSILFFEIQLLLLTTLWLVTFVVTLYVCWGAK